MADTTINVLEEKVAILPGTGDAIKKVDADKLELAGPMGAVSPDLMIDRSPIITPVAYQCGLWETNNGGNTGTPVIPAGTSFIYYSTSLGLFNTIAPQYVGPAVNGRNNFTRTNVDRDETFRTIPGELDLGGSWHAVLRGEIWNTTGATPTVATWVIEHDADVFTNGTSDLTFGTNGIGSAARSTILTTSQSVGVGPEPNIPIPQNTTNPIAYRMEINCIGVSAEVEGATPRQLIEAKMTIQRSVQGSLPEHVGNPIVYEWLRFLPSQIQANPSTAAGQKLAATPEGVRWSIRFAINDTDPATIGNGARRMNVRHINIWKRRPEVID